MRGEKTDWVGKKLTSQFFPQGKNGLARFFPGEKTDWGEIPACYNGLPILAGVQVEDRKQRRLTFSGKLLRIKFYIVHLFEVY